MVTIAAASKELWISKEKFETLYGQVIGKDLTKSTTITEEDISLIWSFLQNQKENDSDKGKYLKGSEIDFWWWSFLSWLGFDEKKDEKKIDLDAYFHGEETEESWVTAVDLISVKKQNIVSENKEKKSNPKKEYRNTKAGGNIQIEKTTYISKEKDDTKSSGLFEKEREKNQEKYNKKNPKKSDWWEWENSSNKNDNKNGNKPVWKSHKKEATTSENLVKKTEVFIDEKITVKEFSEKIGENINNVILKLMQNGMVGYWINSVLDFDTVSLIAAEFWVEVKKTETQLDMKSFISWDLQKILDLDKESKSLVKRAPVVTVMWHVDHGKTSLLDYLRKTGVAEWEAWWITQSIGASMVDYKGEKITFIDTPGHELFTSLRARGAKLTNIAVIVVAADDSVMPQTIESINHAKAAWVPIIIAITKIDKPGKNIDQIKSDIAAQWLTPEEWWGDTPIVWVSSKTGEGIDELLEQILLHAEILELKYDPKRSAVWVVLDSYKDAKQGVITSMIILTGTLQLGNIVLAYNTYWKIKRMNDWKWNPVKSITWWEPVQVLWFNELPEAWRIIEVVHNEKEAQKKIEEIQQENKNKTNESALQEFLNQMKQWWDNKLSELSLILKAEGASSLEALIQAVETLELPKNVALKIVHSWVWQFSETDLSLAQTTKSILLWFNVSITSMLKKKADQAKIEVKMFDIIYELTDYLENIIQWMIEIEQEEVVIGKLEVLWIFHTDTKEMTIWWLVKEGKVKNKIKFSVIRGDEIITSGTILSLQRNKDQVKEVKEGEDCGMKVKVWKKIQEHDILEFYELQDKKE